MESSSILAALAALAAFGAASAVTVDDCVEYVPGNFNMIVTAPHGGYLDVPNCPYRDFGCYIQNVCYYNSASTCVRDPANCDATVGRDGYTQEVARMVVQNIATLMKKTPHMVIMKCTRATLDVNREIEDAAQNCPNAMTAYNNYHGKIKSIYSTFTQGKALLIDIHGQGHKQNSTELGYGINKSALDATVASKTHTFPAGSLDDCTINALRARLTSGGAATDFDVFFGQKSMGYFLEREGFAALPGPTFPKPGSTTYQYFNGGYTIRYHSSATLDAIQMEGPSEVRIDGGLSLRTAYAAALARAITNFYNAYYA